MNILDHIKRNIVSTALKYGLILTPEALEYLVYSDTAPELTLRRLKQKGANVVKLEDIKEEKSEKNVILDTEGGCKGRIRAFPLINEDDTIEMMEESQRREILIERFEKLREILFRSGKASFTSFSRAKRSEEEKTVIALINSIKDGYIYTETDEETAIVRVKNPIEKLKFLDVDMVVGLTVKPVNDHLILSNIQFPGSVSHFSGCERRLLIVPHYSFREIKELPPADVTVVMGVASKFDHSIEKRYKTVEHVLSSSDNVFVIPTNRDLTHYYPPLPSIRDYLDSFDGKLPSPSMIRMDDVRIVLYDGFYNERKGKSVYSQLYSKLIQPDISTIPYLSKRDIILERQPHILITPYEILSNGRLITLKGPALVDLVEGKVTPLWS